MSRPCARNQWKVDSTVGEKPSRPSVDRESTIPAAPLHHPYHPPGLPGMVGSGRAGGRSGGKLPLNPAAPPLEFSAAGFPMAATTSSSAARRGEARGHGRGWTPAHGSARAIDAVTMRFVEAASEKPRRGRPPVFTEEDYQFMQGTGLPTKTRRGQQNFLYGVEAHRVLEPLRAEHPRARMASR
jgi:hypothetical protein